ncbi:vacuolar calcium ion transporter [Apodospora peruviana]|uniref:Vacuolar calcium ion transporter n=1 Tax=Apodospora peruviana TaxID=516989 RepID=A0AAE0M500_9PEZI|nr:vacuolar calcium ion transporter [Apodospora peruviana]
MHRVKSWARAKAHGSPPGLLLGSLNQKTTGPSKPATGNGLSSLDGAGDDGAVVSGSEQPDSQGKASIAARFGFTVKHVVFHSWLNVLLVFVPVGIAVELTHQSAGLIFAMNAIAIIPLAGLLSHSTEVVAASLGDAIGALINVTFGNAVELIIFIIALVKNEIRIVQASLLGSILSNLLLILGMAFFLGGLRYREQIYNSTVTQMSACLLCLAVMSLLLPTAFHASFKDLATADKNVLQVSRGVSVILLLVYALYLLFQLNSHAYMYESTPRHIIDQETVRGPAAQYFDSSSDSDSDSSSSSSDSSSSDSSGGARETVRRVFKRKTLRQTDNSKPASIRSNQEQEVQQNEVEPTSAEGEDRELDVPEGSHKKERKEQRRHHHKKHRHSKHRRASTTDDAAAPDPDEERGEKSSRRNHPPAGLLQDNNTPAAAHQGPAADLEAQTVPDSNRPKSTLLGFLRPTLPKHLSQNVFTTPPPLPPQEGFTTTPRSASRGHGRRSSHTPRRTKSTPEHMNREIYRVATGDHPPHFVPVPVGGGVGRPKTPGAAAPATSDVAGATTIKDEEEVPQQNMSKTSAIILLLVSTALVAVCAEFMVSSINEVVASNSGISEAFIGLILLPIVGNAAEHVTAVTVAVKNKMDLAIGVAVGSSIQIALFVTPLIVILGWILDKQMSLYFTLFETVSLFVSTFIVNFLVLDGRSNYLEGALLVAAYVIIAVAAFFYPSEEDTSVAGGGKDGGNDTTVAAARMVEVLIGRGLASLAGM